MFERKENTRTRLRFCSEWVCKYFFFLPQTCWRSSSLTHSFSCRIKTRSTHLLRWYAHTCTLTAHQKPQITTLCFANCCTISPHTGPEATGHRPAEAHRAGGGQPGEGDVPDQRICCRARDVRGAHVQQRGAERVDEVDQGGCGEVRARASVSHRLSVLAGCSTLC